MLQPCNNEKAWERRLKIERLTVYWIDSDTQYAKINRRNSSHRRDQDIESETLNIESETLNMDQRQRSSAIHKG
jgi:hypothetical protein